MLGRLEVPAITGLVRVSADIGALLGRFNANPRPEVEQAEGSPSSVVGPELWLLNCRITLSCSAIKRAGCAAVRRRRCLPTANDRRRVSSGDLSNLNNGVPRYRAALPLPYFERTVPLVRSGFECLRVADQEYRLPGRRSPIAV